MNDAGLTFQFARFAVALIAVAAALLIVAGGA
jgi:hypothetical protein